MTTPKPQGLPSLRDLTDDERLFLHYNPNTSDLVEFVQDYAREALRAQAATLEAICKIIECAGPEAADEIADLLGYPSVEWPSDQAASSEPVGKIINSGGNTGSLPEHPLLVWLGGVPPVGTELFAGAPSSQASVPDVEAVKSLLSRIRPGVEAAPWVVEALQKIVSTQHPAPSPEQADAASEAFTGITNDDAFWTELTACLARAALTTKDPK